MAYAARQQGAERFTSIGAVLLIHFVLAIVVINQFTPGLIPRIIPPIYTPGVDFTPKPKPPPPPQPAPSAQPHHDNTVFVPQPPTGLPTSEASTVPITDTGPVFTGPTGVPDFGGLRDNPPQPLFTPKSAAPANSPSGWATPIDYPSVSLKLEEQGMTTFRVSVGSDGRVKACEIVKSSGHKRLDDATCNLVSHRARFDPATDKNGEKVVGTYSNSVRWVLPN